MKGNQTSNSSKMNSLSVTIRKSHRGRQLAPGTQNQRSNSGNIWPSKISTKTSEPWLNQLQNHSISASAVSNQTTFQTSTRVRVWKASNTDTKSSLPANKFRLPTKIWPRTNYAQSTYLSQGKSRTRDPSVTIKTTTQWQLPQTSPLHPSTTSPTHRSKLWV